MRYIVTYSLPYRHVVEVALAPPSEEEARRVVEETFATGALWGERDRLTLVHDDFEEDGDSGEALTFEVRPAVSKLDLQPDASVIAMRQQAAARRACKELVWAYDGAISTGQEIRSVDLEAIVELARQAGS